MLQGGISFSSQPRVVGPAGSALAGLERRQSSRSADGSVKGPPSDGEGRAHTGAVTPVVGAHCVGARGSASGEMALDRERPPVRSKGKVVSGHSRRLSWSSGNAFRGCWCSPWQGRTSSRVREGLGASPGLLHLLEVWAALEELLAKGCHRGWGQKVRVPDAARRDPSVTQIGSGQT